MGSEEVFGTQLILMLLGVAVLYLLFALAPVIWPAQRAFRKTRALPRPWLFVAVSALIVYGMMTFVTLAVLVPINVYSTFIAPQFSAGDPHYRSLAMVLSDFIESYFWVVVPVTQIGLSIWIISKLSERWPRISTVLND